MPAPLLFVPAPAPDIMFELPKTKEGLVGLAPKATLDFAAMGREDRVADDGEVAVDCDIA